VRGVDARIAACVDILGLYVLLIQANHAKWALKFPNATREVLGMPTGQFRVFIDVGKDADIRWSRVQNSHSDRHRRIQCFRSKISKCCFDRDVYISRDPAVIASVKIRNIPALRSLIDRECTTLIATSPAPRSGKPGSAIIHWLVALSTLRQGTATLWLCINASAWLRTSQIGRCRSRTLQTYSWVKINNNSVKPVW
jgi:hypothetical protein